MQRVIKFFIVLSAIGIFFLAVVGGFMVIITGSDPLGFARETYLRWTVSNRQEDLERSPGTSTDEIPFVIAAGDTPTTVATKLFNSSLIVDAQLFVDYMIVEDLDTRLQQGTYFLNQAMAIPTVAQTITDRNNSAVVLTVQPGMRIEQVASAIDGQTRLNFTGADFLALVQNATGVDPAYLTNYGIPIGGTLEGFLFPDTYIVSPNISAAELLNSMLMRFEDEVGNQLLIDTVQQGYSMREIVTIASIVEREAVWDDEHPLIASAYRNRLDIGMKLDADPTVQYALQGSRGSWWPNITRADYTGVQSPYNTYLNTGFPPHPISNPSLSAIRAAVYPAESSYIFFRARCDGSNYHDFAVTYEEHLANGC